MPRSKVSITPSTKIFGRLAATNMPIEKAIAELIDNSIDSFMINRAKLKKSNTFQAIVKVNFSEGEVSVSDNCFGMDERAVINALTLGESDKSSIDEGLIGKYGIGLKSAGMVMGKRITVRTKTPDSKKGFEFYVDKDELERSRDWTVNSPVSCDVKFDHGTEVLISRLHKKYNSKTVEKVHETCRKLFRHYIKDNLLGLFVNENPVPEYHVPDIQAGVREFTIKLGGHGTVSGWVGLMKKGKAASGEYGFTLVRNHRVIEEHVKIGVHNSNWESRIVGELYLNNWEVDFTKAKISSQLDGYEVLDRELRKEIKKEIEINKKQASPGTRGGHEEGGAIDLGVDIKNIAQHLPTEVARALMEGVEAGDRLRKPSKQTEGEISKELTNLLTQEHIQVLFKNLGENYPIVSVKRDGDTGICTIAVNEGRLFIKTLNEKQKKVLGYLFAAQAVFEKELDQRRVDRLRALQASFLKIGEKILNAEK